MKAILRWRRGRHLSATLALLLLATSMNLAAGGKDGAPDKPPPKPPGQTSAPRISPPQNPQRVQIAPDQRINEVRAAQLALNAARNRAVAANQMLSSMQSAFGANPSPEQTARLQTAQTAAATARQQAGAAQAQFDSASTALAVSLTQRAAAPQAAVPLGVQTPAPVLGAAVAGANRGPPRRPPPLPPVAAPVQNPAVDSAALEVPAPAVASSSNADTRNNPVQAPNLGLLAAQAVAARAAAGRGPPASAAAIAAGPPAQAPRALGAAPLVAPRPRQVPVPAVATPQVLAPVQARNAAIASAVAARAAAQPLPQQDSSSSSATSSTAARRLVQAGGNRPFVSPEQRLAAQRQSATGVRAPKESPWLARKGSVALNDFYDLEFTTQGHLYAAWARPYKSVWDQLNPASRPAFEDWIKLADQGQATEGQTRFNGLKANRNTPVPTEVTYLAPAEQAGHQITVQNGRIGLRNGRALNGPGQEAVVFVVDVNGEVHAGNYERGRFHHSSLLAGANVLSAGEMYFDAGGKLYAISDKSGHYMPDRMRILQGLSAMTRAGVDLTDVDLVFDGRPVGIKAATYLQQEGWRMDDRLVGPMPTEQANRALGGQPNGRWILRQGSRLEGKLSFVANGSVQHVELSTVFAASVPPGVPLLTHALATFGLQEGQALTPAPATTAAGAAGSDVAAQNRP